MEKGEAIGVYVVLDVVGGLGGGGGGGVFRPVRDILFDLVKYNISPTRQISTTMCSTHIITNQTS